MEVKKYGSVQLMVTSMPFLLSYFGINYLTVACSDLPGIHKLNGTVTYDPLQNVPSALLANEVRFTGTVARYNCSLGYKLVNGSSQRVCSNGTWNGTEPSCQGTRLQHSSYCCELV